MLPARYNQFIVNQFFELTKEDDESIQGLDFQSFIYYDFALRFFDVQNKTRNWFLTLPEFIQTLENPLFNSYMSGEIHQIPMTNYTEASYNMYTYQKISHFNDEQDFLMKFVQKSEEKSNLKKNKLRTRSRVEKQAPVIPVGDILSLASNTTFFLNFTAKRLFEVIDVNSDGYIDWYDYGFFYQTLYLFTKFDPFQKGKITAGDAFEKYTEYSDFPRVSTTLRQRARRFNVISQDTYIDFFNAHVVLRIDDIIKLYTRRVDPTTLYEVELKRVFSKVGLKFVNEGALNRCLRGMDNQNIPKYDWECAFMAGIQDNINYLESASSFNTVHNHNLTLSNTVFYNVDPSLLPTAGPKKFF